MRFRDAPRDALKAHYLPLLPQYNKMYKIIIENNNN